MNTHIKNVIKGTAMGALVSTALFLPMVAKAGTTVHVTHDGTNYGTGNNKNFVPLPAPTGSTGAAGAQGPQGEQGVAGKDGKDGQRGLTGAAGSNGLDAVAPLGSLSFAAATASFSGDGIGFGLSDSNYGGLEGSIALGFDLEYNWRVVVGVTTDFKKRHAASAGVGYSF